MPELKPVRLIEDLILNIHVWTKLILSKKFARKILNEPVNFSIHPKYQSYKCGVRKQSNVIIDPYLTELHLELMFSNSEFFYKFIKAKLLLFV